MYISYYLKKNRIEYYDRLSEVRRTGDFEQWVKFFLRAVCESADDALINIEKLDNLHKRNETLLKEKRASKGTMMLFSYIEQNPIIDVKKTSEELGLSFNTVASAINVLIDLKVLYPVNNNARNRAFSYEDYLDILRPGTELDF